MKKLLVVLLISTSIISFAQKKETYQVHAMMIYNFINYIEFDLPDPNSTFVIGVLSDDLTYKTMLDFYDGKIYKGTHIISIKRVENAAGMTGMYNLIFVTPNSIAEHPAVVKKLEGTTTMLLSAGKELSGKGSVINFILDGGRLNFEISKKQAAAHNIKIASSLLNMGKQID